MLERDLARLADVTFHALVYDRASDWYHVREVLLRFLNSAEGRKYISQSKEPIVVLASDQRRGHPYYLHVTDGALAVLRQLKVEFAIFTSAFLDELPSNQRVLFSA